MSEIELAAGLVQRDSIQQDECSGPLGATRKDAGEATAPTGIHDGEARDLAQYVRYLHKLAGSEIGTSDDGRGNARLFKGNGCARGAYDDAVVLRREREGDFGVLTGAECEAGAVETSTGDGGIAR